MTNDRGKRRTVLWVGAVVAVVAVAAGIGGYLWFFNDDAPAKFAVSTAPAGQAVDASSLPGAWKPAGGSEVGYRVREKLSVLPQKSDAVGRTSAVTGTVRIEQQGSGFVARDVTFEADVRQLKSDRSQRDQRMHEFGLESDTFPTATFVSTAPVAVPGEALQGQKVTVQAPGDLTIHGVTRRVTIPIDARVNGSQIELVGSLNFPLSDYRIEIPSFGGFVTVDGDANLEFRLLLAK